MSSTFRISSALLASAVGDAWGKITEFEKFATLKYSQPAFPQPALITDDTQMAIATMQGIMKASSDGVFQEFLQNPEDETLSAQVRVYIAESYLQWLHDRRNNRAPGATCLNALRAYEKSPRKTGLEGTIPESKGCGANMRNPWLGLLNMPEVALNKLSIIQSEITHSHPLALSSSVLTALVVKESFTSSRILEDKSMHLFDFVENKTEELIALEESKTNKNEVYYEGLIQLLSFWKTKRVHAENYMLSLEGEDACRVMEAEGWVAEEALLLAVVIADKHITSLEKTTLASVYSNGDSDSIATIACTIVASNSESNVHMFGRTHHLENDYMEDMLLILNFITSLQQERNPSDG